jgi:ferredoxin-NADP reductase
VTDFIDTGMTAKLVRLREIAKDTYEITLQTPTPLDYKPGQYIGLTIPDLPVQDAFAKRRDLSMVSAPGTNLIKVAFRSSETPFKQALIGPTPQRLIIRGPHGLFTPPKDPIEPLTFIAGGIGITPFLSILTAGVPVPVTLLIIDSSSDRVAYAPELKELAGASKLTAKRRLGRIHNLAELKNEIEIDPAGLYYVSGPPEFTGSIRTLLRQAGVPPLSISMEEFTGYGTLD